MKYLVVALCLMILATEAVAETVFVEAESFVASSAG